jgi:hypothetical protein
MTRRAPVRRLRSTVQQLADALQAAVGVAEELGQHAHLNVRNTLTLTLRLRRATRVLQRLRPRAGGMR